MTLHDAVQRVCPPDQFDSGQCIAPWFPFVERIVFCGSAALAAGLIVVFCSITAPYHRAVVAVVVFAIGSAVAGAMAIAGDAYLELVSAVIAGLLAVAWVRRRWRATHA